MTDPWARPQPQWQPGPPSAPPQKGSALPAKLKNFFSDPLSIVLVAVIVVALVLAGLLGGELYARHRADTVVASTVECVVQDEATASFGVLPPFLMQHMSGHYTNIHIETAGNQVRDAKGMKLNLDINDVRLQDSANSSGTIGSLVATIDWSSDGIKQTIQGAIPLIGSFVSGVSTNASEGTIELEGALGSITAKPQVVDGNITLAVQQVTGLGFTLPRESVQPALDAFTSTLTQNYPLNIKADSVSVTDSGVQSRLSTQNATMPKQTDDPCFGNF